MYRDKVPVVVRKCYPKRWVINEENLTFSKMMEESVGGVVYPSDINTKCNDLTDRIVQSAAKTIHKTIGKSIEHKRTCWCSADCSKAVAARRRARRQLEKYPTECHVCIYKEKAAIAKNVCKGARKALFYDFVETLQFDTPSVIVWKKIQSTKCREYSDDMPIIVDNDLISNPFVKADLFAEYLQKISQAGRHGLLEDFNDKLQSACNEARVCYNDDITYNELQYTLRTCQDKSPGLDDIKNSMLKNIPYNVLLELLALFDQSFQTGHIPSNWKIGVIIPIWKNGKPKSEISIISSYRPTALLSCTGKLMEKIIQHRL